MNTIKKSPLRVGARKGEQERLIYSEECYHIHPRHGYYSTPWTFMQV
uniref:Uncharacterized protein n=1 Tax=Phage sp. ctPjm15 TaxID=2828006 RepID=A0A8S5SPL3_9VIRU|nr:MAG TPA: hypothetical protein [Phage sp. ctPjm15]DAM92673.1 MAG TPA: hypothetical protein [Caudoviricetes sp.]